MTNRTGPWLYHPEGYVLYRFADKVGFFYNFNGNTDGGYRNWHSAAALKGLRADDFINY